MSDPRPEIWQDVFLKFVGSQGVDKAAEVANTALDKWDAVFRINYQYEDGKWQDTPVSRIK